MNWPRSLVWRLVSRTLAAQVALLAALTVVLSIWTAPPDGGGFFWWQHASQLIVGSLRRDADGALRLVPTPELLDYQARRPGFLFGASADGPGRKLAPGSSGRLAVLFDGIQPLRTHTGAFLVDGDDAGGHPLDGGTLLTDTAFGPVNVFAANGKFQLEDLPAYVWETTVNVGQYAVPALVLGALCMWLTVGTMLRPLRSAARDLAAAEFRTQGQRLPDDGRVPLEILPVVQGVNQALARLEDGLRRQQRFVANAAHEMRTPLGVLLARIESLKDAAERAELTRDGQRVTTLLDQLLAIARLEHRDLDVREEFDLGACAAGVVADLFPLAVDAGRFLDFSAPVDSVMVRGSAQAMASAVSNLIDNALAAEPDGGTVCVVVEHGALVSVADHGPGVNQLDRDLVFEPFWRGAKDQAGTGLGLAIVREIASLHGGEVWIDDTPAGGATFRLSVPEYERSATVAAREP